MMGEWMSGWVDGLMNGQMMDGWMMDGDGWMMDEWIGTYMDQWMDLWWMMGGQMDDE